MRKRYETKILDVIVRVDRMEIKKGSVKGIRHNDKKHLGNYERKRQNE